MNTAAMSDEVRRAISATRAKIIYYKEQEALQNAILTDLVSLSFHERDKGACTHDQDCELHMGDCSL